MFRVKESMHVHAPIDRCFLLSTSVPLVAKILGMKPVSGHTSGLIEMNDRVLWRGWKFGLPVSHETLITAYDRPNFFQDTMARGQFAHFHHDHRLEEVDGHTLLVDVVNFSLPFGAAGKLVGRMIMVPHVQGLLRRRYAMLKRIAEGDDWARYLPPEANRPESAPRATGIQAD
jgi:ligand-binding SRPBCC domain-containing protein